MLDVVMQAFNPRTRKAEEEAGGSLDLEASVAYRVSSRMARATQRDPVRKHKTNKTKIQANTTKNQMAFMDNKCMLT